MSKTALAEREPTNIAPVDDTVQLMRLAMDKGEDGVAALERIIAMKERAEDRAAARQYTEAIARFQQECPVVHKAATGAHGAKYATLDGIMDAIRPALVSAGLSVTFDSEEADDARLRVWCIVHHRAGHSERASFIVSREAKSNRMNDTQRDGSALSYGRRYALCLALGISTGDRDDDGDGAGNGATITAEQAATLKSLAEEVGADIPRFLKWAQAESFATVAASKYATAVKMLEAKR